MASEKLDIIINAKDYATAALKGIGMALGKLALAIPAAAFGALAGGLGMAIKEGMEAQDVMAQLDAVLKSTGESVTILAGGMTDEMKSAVEKLNEKVKDSNADILELTKDLAKDRASIAEALSEQLAGIDESTQERLVRAAEGYAAKISDLNDSRLSLEKGLQDDLARLGERQFERMRDLNESLTSLTRDYESDRLSRANELAIDLSRLDEDWADNRAELEKKLVGSAQFSTDGTVRIYSGASDDMTEAEKQAINDRIAELDSEHAKRKKRMEEDAARREEQLKKDNDARIAALRVQIERENAEYQRQADELKKANAERLLMVQKRVDEENAAYAKQTNEINAENAKRVADAKKASDEELANTQASFSEQLNTVKTFVSEAQKEIDKLTVAPISVTITRPLESTVLGLADSLSQVTRYSDDAILSSETLLLGFRSIGEDIFPATIKTAMDLATRLGRDLPDAAYNLGKALDQPAEASRTLLGMGVRLTDEQNKMIDSMVASGDIMGAQKYILDQLSLSYGGAAEAAGKTFGGQTDIMMNQFRDVLEEIGIKILPTLTQALKDAGPQIIDLMNKFATFVTSDEFLKWLTDTTNWITGEFLPAVIKISDWITQKGIPGFADLATSAKETLSMSFYIAYWWITEKLLPALESAWDWISTKLPDASGKLKAAWVDDWDQIGSVLDSFSTSAERALNTFGDSIKRNIEDRLQKIHDFLTEVGKFFGFKELDMGAPPTIGGITSPAPAYVPAGPLSTLGEGAPQNTTVNIDAGLLLSWADEQALIQKLGPIVRAIMRGAQ